MQLLMHVLYVCFKCNAFTCVLIIHLSILVEEQTCHISYNVLYNTRSESYLSNLIKQIKESEHLNIDLCSVFNPNPNVLDFSHPSSQYLTQEL